MQPERPMELESTLSGKPLLKTSLTSEYLKQCCKPTYHTKWVKCKGAILILAWSFLAMSVVYYYSISVLRDSISMKVSQERPKGSELIGMASLLLIGGWLADAYFGRYKVICSGLWIMWIGSLLSTCSLVIAKLNTTYGHEGDRWVSLFSKLVMGSGFGLFQANIIQFGIDQLSEASSTEITSFITCYTLTLFISGFIMYFSAQCAPDYVGVLVLTVCLTLAVCMYLLFNHVLVKEQIIQNPLPLIWKVVRYSIKNHNIQQRFSSLQDHGFLDIAKSVYAGPFSSEQVEDVKAFFRVIVVIIACSLPHSGTTSTVTVKDSLLPHLQNFPNASSSLSNCYRALTLTHANFTFTVVLVLLYLVIIRPFFYNCIPKANITTKFIIALALYLIRIVALLGIESASYQYQIQTNAANVTRCYTPQNGHYTVTNVDSKWIIVPEIINGLSLFILIPAGLEFVCAQAPFNMKGLIFGITYAVFGGCTLLQTGLLAPFYYVEEAVWKKAPLTCGIWYFLIQAVLVLVCFVLMIMVIRRYKSRTRISAPQSEWEESYSVN